MSYSNPQTVTYRFPAATLSTATVIGRFIGPSGKQGRLVDIADIVTTDVTAAANTTDVGTAADPDAYGTLTTPIAVADLGHNGMVIGATTTLPADTVAEVSTNGECTAGAADVLVTVDWY